MKNVKPSFFLSRDVNTRITPLKRVLMYAIPVTTFAVTVNIPKFLETQVKVTFSHMMKKKKTQETSYACHPSNNFCSQCQHSKISRNSVKGHFSPRYFECMASQ